jgi:hypothetical protein
VLLCVDSIADPTDARRQDVFRKVRLRALERVFNCPQGGGEVVGVGLLSGTCGRTPMTTVAIFQQHF